MYCKYECMCLLFLFWTMHYCRYTSTLCPRCSDLCLIYATADFCCSNKGSLIRRTITICKCCWFQCQPFIAEWSCSSEREREREREREHEQQDGWWRYLPFKLFRMNGHRNVFYNENYYYSFIIFNLFQSGLRLKNNFTMLFFPF